MIEEVFFGGRFGYQPVTSSYRPGTPGWPGFALYDMIQTANGSPLYIGEVGDPADGFTVSPGEPKLPMNPLGNEHYEINHWVQDTSSGHMVTYMMRTSFYAITGPGYTWSRADGQTFPDCVWTSLEERPNEPSGIVYNYVYCRGKGLVDLVWGDLTDKVDNVIGGNDPSGRPTAFEYQAIAWGNLP
jgi:hypothetical protein